MNIREEIDKIREEGYNEANAEARLCQDILLKAISESSLKRNVTIKGGVVMRNLSKSARRATQDIDLDFICYSISDESIRAFIDKLNQMDGLKFTLNKPIKELNHQDYSGKRIFIDILDEYDYMIEGKIDIGVHKDLDVEQEEYCFDICFQEDGASLLMNSREQIITEKTKSLLRFMTRNTRYKDVFDIYYLKDNVNLEKIQYCISKYIYGDGTLSVNNIDDVISRLEMVFSDKSYIKEINRSRKNWIGVDVEKDLNEVKNQLFLYDTSNVVNFINQINAIDDKKQLLDLRQALENYKAMYNLIRLYGYEDLYEHFNVENAIKCLNEVNNRISIVNLKNSIDSSEDMTQVLNMALDQIDFQFRKIKEEELLIADAFRDTLEKTRREIVDRCLDPKDPEYISLLDELKRVFKKKNIEELTADEMRQMKDELDSLRTHKRIMGSPPPIADAITVHRILMTVKTEADDQIAHNENILDNEEYFIKSLQPIIYKACIGENVKPERQQLLFIDNCLSKEYISERDWVS